MTRSHRTSGRRAALRALVAACLLLVCAACAEKRGPDQWDRGGLVDGQVGAVQLIHAHVLAPPMDAQKTGDDLGLYVTLVNNSDRDQVLNGVSTVHADSVVYREGDEQPQPIAVTLPARRTVSLQEGHDRPHLELVGIHRPLGATPIDVTFRFPSAGTITLRVPVLPLSRGAGSPAPG